MTYADEFYSYTDEDSDYASCSARDDQGVSSLVFADVDSHLKEMQSSEQHQHLSSFPSQQSSEPQPSSVQSPHSSIRQQQLSLDHGGLVSSSPDIAIPLPRFKTPPKLRPIEQVLRDYPGSDVATLRLLTTALAREAIFGREELAKKSLSGRNNTGMLEQEKLDYIKTLIKTRVPRKTGKLNLSKFGTCAGHHC